MATFRHAGDLGDIIYSMPTIKALGGGLLYIEASGFTRQRLTPEKWAPLKPLLLSQSYVSDVHEWKGDRVMYNLNDFRQVMSAEMQMGKFDIRKSLAVRMAEAHRVPLTALDKPWLTITPTTGVADVIFARTSRWNGRRTQDPRADGNEPTFPWGYAYDVYKDRAVFVGLESEHKVFCRAVGKIPYYKTHNFLELAQVIAGAILFVGNQSAPYAIAEGMKQNAVLEVWHDGPNCLFTRPNVWQVWDLDTELPKIDSLRRVIELPRTNEFGEDYYLNGEEKGLSNYTNYRWMPEVTIELARQIEKHLKPSVNDNFFDFGCARGYLVRAFRELGYMAFGCDLSKWAIENCDPEVEGFVKNIEGPDNDYDWIIAKDVLEHISIPQLEKTVRQLMARASKGLFIVVPLTEQDGTHYVRPADNADITHIVRWTLPTWMKFLRSIDPGFIISGSYWVPGIKQASEPYDGSTGFITAKRA